MKKKQNKKQKKKKKKNKQEVIQLKSPILLKLGINVESVNK